MPSAPTLYPLIPLRDFVVFPAATMPLFIARAYSIEALARATRDGRALFLVAQRLGSLEAPAEHDLYAVGTVARVVEQAPISNSTRVVVSGTRRARLVRVIDDSCCLEAEVEYFNDPPSDPDMLEKIRQKQVEASSRMGVQTSAPTPHPDADMRVAAMQRILEGNSGSVPETDIMRLARLKKLFEEFARAGNPD